MTPPLDEPYHFFWNTDAKMQLGFCQFNNEDGIEWTNYLYMFLYILHGIDVYNSAVVVFLKDKRDVLQGISKLDYFLKVSIFQIYKDKQL